VLLDLVGKDSFDWLAAELFASLGNSGGNLVVVGGLLDDSLGSLHGVVGSENDVSLAAIDLAVSDDNRCGGVSSISVHVGTADTTI
jgi:hypothetical protein